MRETSPDPFGPRSAGRFIRAQGTARDSRTVIVTHFPLQERGLLVALLFYGDG